MFTVKVIEHKTKTTTGAEWMRLSDSGNPQGGGSIYGYGPVVEKTIEYDVEVFTQKVSDLDLTAVIGAVNRLRQKET